MALMALLLVPPAVDAGGLTGVREISSSSQGPVAAPRAAMARAVDEVRNARAACAEGARGACSVAEFREFVDGLAGQSAVERVAAVNRYVNRARYVEDAMNYGMPDYWAAPSALFVRGGDCEDYAIAKYAALRLMGVPDTAMRIYVARHLEARRAHAVLMVSTSAGTYVLDNEVDTLRPLGGVGHLQPLYSLNQAGYWLYLPS